MTPVGGIPLETDRERQRDAVPRFSLGCTAAGAGNVETMKSRAARSTLTTVAVIVIVVGAIWIGQGAGLIPGSFMTGDQKWLIIGIVLAVVGIVMLVVGLRKPKR